MGNRLPTRPGASIRQDTNQTHAMLGKGPQHPVIQQVSPGDRRLGGIELGHGDLAIAINESLLVDAAHSLDCAGVEGA